MYTIGDLFYKLMDMGLSIKGLLTRLRQLSEDTEVLDWTMANDGSSTRVTLEKVPSEEKDKEDTWNIKGWE